MKNLTGTTERLIRVGRNEGRRNYGYGPRPGAKRSILSIRANADRERKVYAATPRIVRQHRCYREMTVGELRAAAKAAYIPRYSKMNKATLIASLTFWARS